MGFGGSAQAMITIIKNNRNMMSKRDKFKKASGGFNIIEGKYQYPKTSEKELRELRLRLKEEKRKRQIKIYVILGVIVMFLITTLVYFA